MATVKIIHNGMVIGGLRPATRGDWSGYAGQLYAPTGERLAFVPELGICTLKKATFDGEKAVEIVAVKHTKSDIMKDLRHNLSGKRLAVVSSDDATNELIIKIYLKKSEDMYNHLTLNTQGSNRYGLDSRYLNEAECLELEEVRTIDLDSFIEACNEKLSEKEKADTLGVICEKVIFNAKKAYTDRRRKNDAYKDRNKPLECKANISGAIKMQLAQDGIGIADATKNNSTSHSNIVVWYK